MRYQYYLKAHCASKLNVSRNLRNKFDFLSAIPSLAIWTQHLAYFSESADKRSTIEQLFPSPSKQRWKYEFFFYRKNVNRNLATCSNKFELKVASLCWANCQSILEHCAATLQSSHRKNIRFDCNTAYKLTYCLIFLSKHFALVGGSWVIRAKMPPNRQCLCGESSGKWSSEHSWRKLWHVGISHWTSSSERILGASAQCLQGQL